MSKYFEIDAQSKFRIPKNATLTGGIYGLMADIGRLMYSEANERLYLRGFSTWIEVSTPYDILDQGTKILFGSYPLPLGWTIIESSFNDRIVLLDTNISQLGNTGGSWTITGMNTGGSHNHNLAAEMASITTQIDYGYSAYSSSGWHGHFTSTDSGHTHTHAPGWRPYNIRYCIGEYDQIIPPSLYLQKDADADLSVALSIGIPAGKTVTVAWGDGDTTDVIGPEDYKYCPHSYADTGTNYTIEITGDISSLTYFSTGNGDPISGNISGFAETPELTNLSLKNTNIDGDISAISGLTSLTDLTLFGTDVTGNISGISTLTALVWLDLVATNVTGAISAFSSLTSMVTLYATNTNISGDIADLSPLINLGYITLSGCSNIDTYTQGTLPCWDACSFNFRDCTLSSQEVDDFLCDLNTSSVHADNLRKVYIDGTNAAPTGTGLACRTSLLAKNWQYIYVN